MSNDFPRWTVDEYGCLNLRFVGPEGREIHAFIMNRQPYCDRGHWIFNVDGIGSIDGADSFPRYFMSLETAITEASEWLNWRLYKVSPEPSPKPLQMGFEPLLTDVSLIFEPQGEFKLPPTMERIEG